MVEVAKAAQAASTVPNPPYPLDLLLYGLAARFTRGPAFAASALSDSLLAFRLDTLADNDLRWRWLTCSVAPDVWMTRLGTP